LFIAGGAVAIATALIDSVPDSAAQRGLNALTALVGAWMVVEVLTLNQGDIKWWSFGSAAAIAAISAIGLAVHEMSTERVVHELRVTHHEDARRQNLTPSGV
jgi:hypothetical protein